MDNASGKSQFRDAIECVNQLIVDGLRHGFFRCEISIEIGKGSRRELVIEAGMSHKFNIAEEELPH
jgi:hypothetical protein